MAVPTNLKKAFPLIIFLVVMLAFASCSLQTPQPEAPTATAVTVTEPEPTDAPPATEPPTAEFDSVSFSFGPDIAGSWTVEFVPEGPGSSSSAGPVEYNDPEHIIFQLDNYAVPAPAPESPQRPQIFIYPAVQMAEQNPGAAQGIEGLRAFLDTPPADLMDQGQAIPFLPLYNAAQVFHTQVKFIDFQNGKGVRFLTMYAQGPMPVVNAGIFYTFQGLTNDGQYYVAAVLPVNHPSLKANANEAFDTEGDDFMTDPINYIAGMAEMLDRQASSTFTPDLTALDAMIESLLVRP